MSGITPQIKYAWLNGQEIANVIGARFGGPTGVSNSIRAETALAFARKLHRYHPNFDAHSFFKETGMSDEDTEVYLRYVED